VHAAVVTKILNKGDNAEDIIITESLKGAFKRVVQNNMNTLVTRYPFGGLAIRRPDPVKFPNYAKNAAQITAWGDKVTGQPFDKKMVNPLTKHIQTGKRFVSVNPSCAERKRADAMWKAGGPGQYTCAQLVAWTVAFAGGLNIDTSKPDPHGCSVPAWVVPNVQPTPGDLKKEGEIAGAVGSASGAGYLSPNTWSAPCDKAGCWVGTHV